jgi:hypothetical protein
MSATSTKQDMAKSFGLIPRRRDLSEAEFFEHWVHPHGTLVKQMTRLRRYVQSRRIRDGVAGIGRTGFDGIAITWFDDPETALSMGEDPVYRERVAPDEPLFIDMDGLKFVLADEYVPVPGPVLAQNAPPGVKEMILLQRAVGLEPSEFAAEATALLEGLIGAVNVSRMALSIAASTNYTGDAQPVCDAIVELTHGIRDPFDPTSDGAATAVVDLFSPIIDGSRTRADLFEERRVVWPD